MSRDIDIDVGEQFNEIAGFYDDNLQDLLMKYNVGEDTDKFAEYKIKFLKKLLTSDPDKVLDFGCGVGRSIGYIKKYFPKARVYGCDVSEDSLVFAQAYTPKDHLFLNDSVETVIKRGKFDLIFISCVLHHIKPDERDYWINGLKESLNPGGHIAVFEHNLLNPVTKSIVLDDKNLVDDITWMLGHKELEKLLGEHKYWSGYTLFSPVRFPGVLGIERLLKWLPLGAQQCVIIEK